VVDQPGIAHDVDPAHGADNEADPERQHDEKKENLFVAAFAAVEEIGGDVAHDHAENDGFKGYPDGTDENFGVEKSSKNLA
jgi:hypothetical protein